MVPSIQLRSIRRKICASSQLLSSADVSSMHVKIGEEMAGRSLLERTIEGEALRERGNVLYKEGKFEEALQVYNEGITINPFDVRLFTNAAICQINLNKNEEAITTCSIATDIQPFNTKAHLLGVRAACNLGFVESARSYGEEAIERLPPNEWPGFMAEVERLAKDVPRASRRPIDKRELERTKKRLISNEERNAEVYNFLLLHIMESCSSPEEMVAKCFPTLLKCLTEAPYISTFVKDPITTIETLSSAEFRLLGSYIVQVQLMCEDNFEACEKLVREPVFIPFLANLGRALAKRSTLQSTFSRLGPGSLVYMLATLAKYPSLKNQLYKETPPFDDLSFYVHLMAIYPGIFDTMDSPDTNMFVDCITAVLVEPWFIEKLEQSLSSPRMDHAFSMLATISTIFLQSRSAQFRVEKQPFASFLPFWLKISARPKIAAVLAARPGVWHHFATRLRYATKDLEKFLGQMHHRDHLENTLRIFKNLSQHVHSPIFEEDQATCERIQESFTALLNFRDKCSSRLTGFIDLASKYVLHVLKLLSEVSPKFASSFLANKQQPPLPKVAALASNSINLETSSAAITCFAILVKNATSIQIAQFEKGDRYVSFIQKLVEVLVGAKAAKPARGKEESGEVISNDQLSAIEILRTLFAIERDEKENDPMLKALLVSNPRGLVEALAILIRKKTVTKEEPLKGAELLLANLVSLSGIFSDACHQITKELSCATLIAAQESLKQTTGDDERKKLENLVSVLTA